MRLANRPSRSSHIEWNGSTMQSCAELRGIALGFSFDSPILTSASARARGIASELCAHRVGEKFA